MSSKDWDKELSKIDRQLESISDEALFPTKGASSPAEKEKIVAKQKSTGTLGVVLRLLLAIALGVGIWFWPYEARCGLGLAGYLAAIGVVTASGVWSAIWSWRHRSGRAHVLSLLIVVWGSLLAAQEILPRVGYAKDDPTRVGWGCS